MIAHVTFKEESRLFSYAGHYYQQRFEFADSDEPLSLDQFLRSGTQASDRGDRRRLPSASDSRPARPAVHDALERPDAPRRLARALLAKPELLVLDDPFIGLDAAGRADLSVLLGELVRDGKRIVLICRADAVPEWVTHVSRLGTPERGSAPRNPSKRSDRPCPDLRLSIRLRRRSSV